MWGPGAGGRAALPGLRGLCEVWLNVAECEPGEHEENIPW